MKATCNRLAERQLKGPIIRMPSTTPHWPSRVVDSADILWSQNKTEYGIGVRMVVRKTTGGWEIVGIVVIEAIDVIIGP